MTVRPATSLYVSVDVPCCHARKESRLKSMDECSHCQRRIAQADLARAAVGSGPNGGTEAPSRAERRPYGPWKIVKTSRGNTCLESVDGCVVCTVSASRVVLRAGAGRLVV
eukprot:12257898-Alexandrium_andersonii.AAC.1